MTYWHSPEGTLHEIYTGEIFVGELLLGPISYDSGRPDLLWHRCSYAFFCRHCGEIWARIVMKDSFGRLRAFEPVVVACPQHGDMWNIPGSLLADHLERLLSDFPPDAIRREFAVHLDYFSKEQAE